MHRGRVTAAAAGHAAGAQHNTLASVLTHIHLYTFPQARIEDGSLPQLLDMLLEFSTTHSPRQIDVSAANLSFLTSHGNDSTNNAGAGAGGIGIGRQQSVGLELFETAGGPGGAAAAGSGVTRTSDSQGGVAGDRVRAALGLQSTKSQWRPGRLGR